MFQSFLGTHRFYGSPSKDEHISPRSLLSVCPFLHTSSQRSQWLPLPLLREVGIRILNYLGDGLILTHSGDLLCAHRDLVLD